MWSSYQRDQRIHVRNKVALVFGLCKELATKDQDKDAIHDAKDEDSEEKEDLLKDKSDVESKELKKVSKKALRKEKKLNKRIDDITDSIWRQGNVRCIE